MSNISFQWLKDYQKLEDEISYLETNLERNKRELSRWMGGDLAKYKLVPESNGAKLEEIIEGIEYELAHKLNDLYDLGVLINTFRGIENKIVYKRYVEGKALGTIANELNYSLGYVKKKHAEIARTVKFVEDYNSVRKYTFSIPQVGTETIAKTSYTNSIENCPKE